MYDSGVDIDEMEKITGRSSKDLYDHIALMKKGEERLIQGVEDGIYTISFATNIAKSDDALTQKLIMDAFDDGMITPRNLELIRKIINSRKNKAEVKPIETLSDLKNQIREMKEKMKSECEQAEKKECRLYRLLNALKAMKESKEFLKLMKECGVSRSLKLKGKYPDSP